MDRDRALLDDRKLLDYYAQFLQVRSALGEIYPVARYDDFVDRGVYPGAALRATMTASEHILSISNAVNRFCYDLHRLTSWERVLATLTEEEKLSALFEFVTPTADHCLSSPYPIRQMFIKSVCQISHQTHRFFIREL